MHYEHPMKTFEFWRVICCSQSDDSFRGSWKSPPQALGRYSCECHDTSLPFAPPSLLFVTPSPFSLPFLSPLSPSSETAVNTYSHDTEKRPRRTPKNKKMAANPPLERLSTYSIRYMYIHHLSLALSPPFLHLLSLFPSIQFFLLHRLVLKEFCVQLLECCFNVLMRVVKVTPSNSFDSSE